MRLSGRTVNRGKEKGCDAERLRPSSVNRGFFLGLRSPLCHSVSAERSTDAGLGKRTAGEIPNGEPVVSFRTHPVPGDPSSKGMEPSQDEARGQLGRGPVLEVALQSRGGHSHRG